MKNIFYFLITIYLIDLSSQFFNSGETDSDIEMTKNVELCIDKLFNNTQFKTCTDAVNKKWEITDGLEKTKVRCCADWDDIICLENYVEKVCNAEVRDQSV